MHFSRANLTITITFVGLTLLALSGLRNLQFDFDFEAFFPAGDEDLEYYQYFREELGPDDTHLLIGFSHEPSIFEESFLKRIDSFASDCRQLPHIDTVISITTLKYPLSIAGMLTSVPVVHLNDPKSYARDSVRVINDPLLRGRLISPDATSLVVWLITAPSLTVEESNELTYASYDLLRTHHLYNEAHIAGRSNYQTEFIERTQFELLLFSAISALIITILLYILYRKVANVLIALITVGTGTVLFLGLLAAVGVRLNPVGSLFPVIMIIVGVSDVVHLITKYIDERWKSVPRKEALKVVVREIGLATFLTSLTTAIGFATLYTSQIVPIKEFGLTAALGVMIAYITAMLLTMSLLSMVPLRWLMADVKQQTSRFWERILAQVILLVEIHSKKILIVTGLILGVCAAGISMVSTDVHLDSNFPRNSKTRADFQYFESEFGGVRTFDLAVEAGDGYRLTDPEVVRAVDMMEEYLDNSGQMYGLISPNTGLKLLNRAYHNNRQAAYRLPQTADSLEHLQRILARGGEKGFELMVNREKTLGRIAGKYRDIGLEATENFKARIRDFGRSSLDTNMVTFRPVGSSHLLDKHTEYVRHNILYGLGLAFIIISLLMALLFRNLKMVFISLIPNILPLLVCGAVAGFAGLELDPAASIVFALSFGIAVDDTIHFLSKYRLLRARGVAVDEAVRLTIRETGKAICMTSITLFFGFGCLIFSQYPPTYTIGILTAFTLLTAVAADLLLAPVLIRWWMK